MRKHDFTPNTNKFQNIYLNNTIYVGEDMVTGIMVKVKTEK